MAFLADSGTLVLEVDGEAGVEEGEFAEAGGEAVEFELDGIDEDRGVREEGDHRAGFAGIDLADDVQRDGGFAALEADQVDFAVAHDFRLEPVGEGVDALGADAVEAAGVFVGALAELAAGVEIGEHEFDGGHAEFLVHVDRNAAAVVGDGNGAVDVDGDLDAAAIAGEMLVDGVVEDLENAVVETALVGVADIHAGALANGIKALELVDLGGIVNLRCGYLGFGFLWLVRRLGHSGARGSKILPRETRNFVLFSRSNFAF